MKDLPVPRLPKLAILLGVAGLIPFLALGFGAAMPDPAMRRLPLLIGYGAVILSFLGGVHEGFAIIAPAPLPGSARPPGDPDRAERLRLLGASACSVLGWFALVLTAYLRPWVGLVALIAGFVALAIIEQRAARHGWMPPAYLWLRWVLTAIVVLVLGAVLVLRLIGAGTGT